MSCETDFAKTRSQSNNNSGKQLRGFKKRMIQQNKYSIQPYTDWGKKIFMIQNEVSANKSIIFALINLKFKSLPAPRYIYAADG